MISHITLEELMERFNPEFHLEMQSFIERGEESLRKIRSESEYKHFLCSPTTPKFKKSVEKFRGDCLRIGMVTTADALADLNLLLQTPPRDHTLLLEKMQFARCAAKSELGRMCLFVVEAKNVCLMSKPRLFGDGVFSSFRSARTDIEEAGKCLALDRGTACVFHLMRVMEVGLRVLGKSLNDPTLVGMTTPDWGRILSRCENELKKKPQDRSPEWKAQSKFYSDATARLQAVKEAWRNPTMHIENKYTTEEAQDIWNHVGSFMRLLSTKLKEQP